MAIADNLTPRFFSALPDLPLMDNMIELTEQNVIFDKAYGRIIETSALLKQKSQNEATHYYKLALPQLGWTQTAPRHFKRGQETLNFSYERQEDGNIIVNIIAKSSQKTQL